MCQSPHWGYIEEDTEVLEFSSNAEYEKTIRPIRAAHRARSAR
jgi:hypothetical protein